MIEYRKPWRRQPRGVGLDLSERWKSLGLVKVYTPGRHALAISGAATTVATPHGLGFSASAASASFSDPASPSLVSGAQNWTILAAFATTQATAANGRCIYAERPDATQIIKVTVGANDNFARLVARNSSNVLIQVIGTSNVRDGSPKVVAAVRYGDNDHQLFVNGVSERTEVAGIGNLFGTAATPTIGNDPQDPINSIFTGGIALVALFRSALSPHGIKALSDNPWQLFQPRRIFVPQAGITGLPTLSLATYVPGSLTSSGFRPRVTATY